MRRILLVILFIFSFDCGYAGIMSSLNNIFSSGHHSRRSSTGDNKKSLAPLDGSLQLFKEYCASTPTSYGFQIRCQPPGVLTTFIPAESAIVRCQQQFRGINAAFPPVVALSLSFLNSLNLCPGQLQGPNGVNQILVNNESGVFKQHNTKITYYDVLCSGKAVYESRVYESQQQAYNQAMNNNIQACIAQIPQPQAHNFVVMFYICIGLALISLGIILWRCYQKRKQID